MSDAADIRQKDELRALAYRLLELADDEIPESNHERLPGQRKRMPAYDYDMAFLRLVARAIGRNRQLRSKYFDAELFGEPAWDILINLFINATEHKRARTKTICLTSGVPETTALRYIVLLEERGLVDRTTADDDARVTYVTLSAKGMEKMKAFLGGECAPSNAPSPLMLAS